MSKYMTLTNARGDEIRFVADTLNRYAPCADGCWLWTRMRDRKGYGMATARVNGARPRPALAHRIFYMAHVGPIPEGLVLDHLCRNRACVNPAHLEPVTNRENLLRGDTITARHAARTHCPQGHEYTPENTYTYRGMRNCNECRRARNRAISREKRAEYNRRAYEKRKAG